MIYIQFDSEDDLYEHVAGDEPGTSILCHFRFDPRMKRDWDELFRLGYLTDERRFYMEYIRQMEWLRLPMSPKMKYVFLDKAAGIPDDLDEVDARVLPLYMRQPYLQNRLSAGTAMGDQMIRMRTYTLGVQAVLALLLPLQSLRHQGVGCAVRFLPRDAVRELSSFLYHGLEDNYEREQVKRYIQ
jgi:hypothetical protein